MNTLNETKIIVPAGHTESVARAIFALEEGIFTKIICGAANTNAGHVERLALLYALSGVHVIDVAPSQKIIQAAKAGIKKASELYNENPGAFSHYKEPVIMVSINAGDDLHFRKAEINYEKCTNCLECIDSCPAGALSANCHCEKEQSSDEAIHQPFANSWIAASSPLGIPRNDGNKLILNKNNCFGCGKCSEACLQNAIEFTNFNNSLCHCEELATKQSTNQNGLLRFARNDEHSLKAVEIHTGNNSIEEVKNFLELNVSLLKNMELLSFCVESKRFNPAELQNYVSSLINLVDKSNECHCEACFASRGNLNISEIMRSPRPCRARDDKLKKVIIQIDGIPMGATDKHCSSLQAVSAAAILLENKLDAYIQLSGGANHFTKKLVNQLGLKISGIAYGTFARKIILSYLDELEENFNAQLLRIVNITTSLVDN